MPTPASATTTIYVIEDEQPIVQIITAILEQSEHFRLVGFACDGHTGVKEIRALQPQIVILDLVVPPFQPAQVARDIKLAAPQASILIYSGFAFPELMQGLDKSLIKGAIEKSATIRQFREGLEAIRQGREYFTEEYRRLLRDGR